MLSSDSAKNFSSDEALYSSFGGPKDLSLKLRAQGLRDVSGFCEALLYKRVRVLRL